MANQIETLGFGSGIVIASPSGGNLAANPTPIEADVLQNVSLDISGDIKSLFGQNQYPIDTAVGKREIKGTFEIGRVIGAFLNNMFLADVVNSGVSPLAYREGHSVPGSGPFTVTVANSTVFVNDEGVWNANTGNPMTRVSSVTASGQYSVSAGVYTFFSGDAGIPVQISYTYTDSVDGNTYQINNHTMGYGPVVSLNFRWPYQNNYAGIFLQSCRLGKISFKTKLDDYMMLSVDYAAFANSAGNVGYLYVLD
jgi:hypothetical protein